MKKNIVLASIVIIMALVAGRQAVSHCQIPCGIYGDGTRFTIMSEHIDTIGKSITQIEELSEAKDLDHNQMVRWVNNKDEHADKLSEIITYYFMAQRVSPVEDTKKNKKEYENYIKQVTLLHRMLVTSMKAKQTVEMDYVEELRELLHDFQHTYEAANED